MIVAAHQHRVAEVGEAVDSNQQEGTGDTGGGQLQGDGAEKVPSSGTEILSRQLEIGTYRFQNTGDGDVGEREEGDGLDDPKTECAVEVCLQPQQIPCDEAAAAEQHDEGKTGNNGGSHSGQQSDNLEEALARHIRIVDGVGIDEAKDDCGCGSDERGIHSVAEGGEELSAGNGPLPVICGRNHENLGKGIDDEDTEKQKDGNDAAEEGRLPEEKLQLPLPAGAFVTGS